MRYIDHFTGLSFIIETGKKAVNEENDRLNEEGKKKTLQGPCQTLDDRRIINTQTSLKTKRERRKGFSLFFWGGGVQTEQHCADKRGRKLIEHDKQENRRYMQKQKRGMQIRCGGPLQ